MLKLRKFFLKNIIDLYFDYFNNFFFFKVMGGFIFFRMPSFFFFQFSSFFFFKSFFLSSFVGHISSCLRFFCSFFFVRFKMRGLGYRVKHITRNIVRFFIGTTNFFYFLSPICIFLRARRRRLLLVSTIKIFCLLFFYLFFL